MLENEEDAHNTAAFIMNESTSHHAERPQLTPLQKAAVGFVVDHSRAERMREFYDIQGQPQDAFDKLGEQDWDLRTAKAIIDEISTDPVKLKAAVEAYSAHIEQKRQGQPRGGSGTSSSDRWRR